MNDNNVTALFSDSKSVPIQNNGIIKEKPFGGYDMEKTTTQKMKLI